MRIRNVSRPTEDGMNPELPHDIEIGYSRSRCLPLIGVGVLMTLLSASIAFSWFPYRSIGSHYPVIGDLGIALFGLATAKLIWAMCAAKGPVLFVSRYGIRDLRVADEFILWDCIAQVSACEVRKQRFVVLTITPALEKRLFASSTGQALLRANRAFGLDGIAISVGGLATDFDELLSTCAAYHAAAVYPTRSQPKADAGAAPRLVAGFA
jgi:hypothetical protein